MARRPIQDWQHTVSVEYSDGRGDVYATLCQTKETVRQSAARDLNDARQTARERGVRIVSRSVIIEYVPIFRAK